MTAFHEVQFPVDISSGATGGAGFKTIVLTLASGFETRNQEWSLARGKWNVGHGAQTDAQIAALINFFHARRGKTFGFRFKDWNDFRAPFWEDTPGDIDALPTLFTTDGTTATFQLTKPYGDAGGSYSRIITKPVAGSLALYDNNSPATPLTSPTDFTWSTVTGIVTLSNTIKARVGHPITGHFEFDTPVRFDTDDLMMAVRRRGLADWAGVPLIELRT